MCALDARPLSPLSASAYDRPHGHNRLRPQPDEGLDALYAERHVTRAGSRIGLSQSAMSGALTRLRELLGDELFVRTPFRHAADAPRP